MAENPDFQPQCRPSECKQKKVHFKKACQKIGLKLRILEKKEAFLKQLKKGLPDEIIRKSTFSVPDDYDAVSL